MRTTLTEVTARERQEHLWQKEILELQLNHQRQMKELENEIAELEVRFGSWLRLPGMLIKLPVWLVMGIGYCIKAIRGEEPDESFWQYLK